MASIQRHGKKWRAQLYKDGVRISRVFDTKMKAQASALRSEVKLANAKLGHSKILLSSVIDTYVRKASINKKAMILKISPMRS